MSQSPTDATTSLVAHARGDPGAAARLVPLVYDELRALAAHYMRHERRDHTLQPTALVNEAYLRLIDIDRIDWKGKTHFIAMAARQMRRILVDHARRAGADKRGAGFQRVTLNEEVAPRAGMPVDALALHEALEKMERRNPRRSQVAELRLFGGLSTDEVAEVLEISATTVRDEWRVARAWLARELGPSPGH